MKYFYMVLEETTRDEKQTFAYVRRFSTSENLASILPRLNLRSATLCESRKRAQEITDRWNEIAKEKGTYMYS